MSRPTSTPEIFDAPFAKAFVERQGYLSRHPSTPSVFEDTTSNSFLSSPPEILETPSVTDESVGSVESVEDPDHARDKSRLKGVHWPGMDIFDSATPDARRKRNQKKDAGVLERLENDSQDIEATEQVWSPGGNLRKEKYITGMPSSSPTLAVTPPPPKRPRAALTQLNVPRQSTRSTQLGRRSTWEDDEAEHDLNYGKTRRPAPSKRRKVVNVYAEKSNAEAEINELATLVRPRNITQLTRGFEVDQKENVLPMHHGLKLEVEKYLDFDHDEFDRQAPFGRPVEPQRLFESQTARQPAARFSMAQPMSQPTVPITVPIDLASPYSGNACGFDAMGGHMYEHTVASWQQASDCAPSYGHPQLTTPQNNHFYNMLLTNQHETPTHLRNSSNDMRMLSSHTPLIGDLIRQFSVNPVSPLRRTQSQPLPMITYPVDDAASYIEKVATQDAALRALTDAALLMDGGASFHSTVDASQQDIEEPPGMDLVSFDCKEPVAAMLDDENRTITAPPSSFNIEME